MIRAISAFAKKGEFKQEELEWSGVEDWLSEQTGKVTKQQVLDYLSKNNVQIKEVVKGATDYAVPNLTTNEHAEMRELLKKVNYLGFDYVDQATNAIVENSDWAERWDVSDETRLVELGNKLRSEMDILEDSKTKHSQWQEPGGENYKEVLLTLPTREESRYNLIEHKTGKAIKSFKNYDAAFEYINSKEFNDFAIKGKTNYGIAPAKKTADYTGSHWEEPNVLAHLRLNERTDSEGNKILFTEEVQSDWASDIRKKGVDKSDRKKIEKARKEMDAFASTMKEKYNDPRPYHVMAADEQSKLKELQKIYDRALGETGSVPDMPFKKTYYLLAMKRMVRLAAEGGFDAVAWGKGAVHFARWGSERIMWKKHKNSWLVDVKEQIGGNVEHEGQRIDIEAMAEAKGMNTQSNTLVTTRDGLRDMIDSIAQRERGNYTPAIYEKMVDARTDKTWKRMQDEDFGVSLPRKEGFENIYDEMIPNEVNKFFNKKKWGNAKVGTTKTITEKNFAEKITPEVLAKAVALAKDANDTVSEEFLVSQLKHLEANEYLDRPAEVLSGALWNPNPWPGAKKPPSYYFNEVRQFNDKTQEIWTLPITPEIKQKALREGMPMFSVKDKKLSPLAQEYLDMLIAANPNIYPEKDTKDDPFKGLRKEVAERMELNKGLGRPPRFQKLKEFPQNVWNLFTRSFEDLDPKKYGGVSNVLRLHKEVSTSSKRRASTIINQIIGGLHENQYNIFRMEIIMSDMLKDIESGLLKETFGLPFGFKNKAEVEAYYKEILKSVDADPHIKDALRRRSMVNEKLKQVLVRNGLLNESVLDDPRYFHHQVMQYRAAKEIGKNEWTLSSGTGTQALHLRKKGWQKARKGSIQEYNTDYIQSEYEVLAQGITQLETKHTLNRLKGLIDMTAALKLQAKAMEVEWKDFILPEGLVEWQPAPGSAWFRASSLTDRMMIAIQSGEITDPNIIKKVWAKGKDATWIVPKEIAKTLNDFGKGDVSDIAIDKLSRTAMTAWKKWILINPYRIIKYNLNNMSGDFDIAFAYDPKIMKYFNQARKDLWAEYRHKPLSKELKGELDVAYRQAVIGSGWAMQDIEGVAQELSYDPRIQALSDSKPGFIKRAWKWSADITTYRENVLRLAAYRYFKDRIEGGEKNIYAASNKEEIDAIQGNTERAAKLARDLIGDYGNISAGGQWLRRHMIPFWSWCVPVDTEILTKEGWKFYDQLTIGEDVLTYNTDNRTTEWQGLEDFAVKPVDEPLETFTNSYGFRYRFTKDHRVVVGVKYKNREKIVLAKDIKSHHSIPLAAPHVFKGKSILSAKDAAVLGWVVTDGYFRQRGKHFESMIYQSPKNYAAKIRKEFSEYISSESIHPDTGVICFRLKAAKTRNIFKVFKSYDDLPKAVTRLDEKACLAMRNAMMEGDGHDAGVKGRSFTQKRQSAIDAFQILCYRLGEVFNIRPVKKFNHIIHGGYIRKNKKLQVFKWLRTSEQYKGLVWCPKTPNKTWIMRQDGKVMITGNCEVNAPRYARLMRNLKHEGEGGKGARIAGVAATKIAWKGTKLAVKATALMAAVMLWNRTFFPDEEDELGESQRRQMHLILGRRSDGTVITLRFQGALSDALSWFGGEDIAHDFKDVASGKASIAEKAKDAALAPIIKLINGIRPDLKVASELLAGKSYYPDPFFPRPIRDHWEHVARTFSLDSIERYLTGKPKRGGTLGKQLLSDIMSLGFYTSDPGEAAFWNVKKKAYDYLEKLDVQMPRMTPTDKANAMYYYKKALRYGDLKAAERYLKSYIDHGGTRKGMKLSIKSSSPLGMMTKKQQRGFEKTLTERDKITLATAETWYEEVYRNPKNAVPWPYEYYIKERR
ncbi:MAG TPA: hypothetical protein VMW44_00720 [Candidatus Bathyarchaeia archaeon]|nr:hypothetical protein [Candidatus Bathyarchaeia archaeon]